MGIWITKVGCGNHCLRLENEYQHDKFAVAILFEGRVVGHAPKNVYF